ncbi:hypothetical protein FQA39_LY00745 [Lamprigera yunnana]|nr:hypothetical protein FQA39_LY00745 [Lamprigera yunnana]
MSNIKISRTISSGPGYINMKLVFNLYFGIITCTALQGDNICPDVERFTTNVTQYVLHTATIRNYKWCLSVPPRCSYYIEEKRYVPTVIEKSEFRTINKCCPGFVENNATQTCVFDCSTCKNGECEQNNSICICHLGFTGIYCERDCSGSRWGKNCEHECTCTKGDCNPITGYCNCPPGWKGSRCEDVIEDISLNPSGNVIQTTTSTYTEKTVGNVNHLLKHLTKHTDRTHYTTFQKYLTFVITTLSPSTQEEVENEYTPYTTTRNVETSTTLPPIWKQSIYEKSMWPKTNFTSTKVVPAVTDDSILHESSKRDQIVINATTDQFTSVTELTNIIVKEKVMEAMEVSVTSTQTVSSNTTWHQQTHADLEINLNAHQNEVHINGSHLIFSIGAVAGILATIIIVVAIAILTTQNARNKPTNSIAVATTKDKDGDGGISSVSIYTRSVFHAPLPEPPVFENSTFTTPLENTCVNRGTGTMETKVVCSMQHLHHRINNSITEEFYDHPPSTGSYRAAPIPLPPEQDLQLVNSESKEHLYDEIPCWKHPLAVSDLPSIFHNNGCSYYANASLNKNL